MTATEHATTRANKLLEKMRKEYDGLQTTIQGYETQLRQATEEMDKAEAVCDLDRYTTARNAKANAEAALEMFRRRANTLEREPVIERAEYERLCGDIVTEFNEHMDKMAADLYDITEKLIDMYDEAEAKLADSNEALRVLQLDLYRGFDLEYSGEHVNDRSKRKVGSREQFDIMNWANSIEKSIYESMKKARANNG